MKQNIEFHSVSNVRTKVYSSKPLSPLNLYVMSLENTLYYYIKVLDNTTHAFEWLS